MKKLPLACVVLMAMFVTGSDSLVCSSCSVGIAGRCLFGSTLTCSETEANCYHQYLAFNVSSLLKLHSSGCLASFLCNQTDSGAVLTAGYTFDTTCCGSDLCNTASSARLPLSAALAAALVSVGSHMGL